MTEKIDRRNCYCDSLWEKSPEILRERNIPFGFCGFCDFCGDFGHTRHYPGPVPSTGSWCDICYKVEPHFGPVRNIGVWSYNSADDCESIFAQAEAFDFNFISSLLSSIKNPKSALVINLPSNISVHYRVKPDKLYEFRFSDYNKGFFVYGIIEFDSTEKVLQISLRNQNLRDEFGKLELHFDYFED